MRVELIDVSGKVLQIKLRGVLKKADHARIIQTAKKRSPGREKSGR